MYFAASFDRLIARMNDKIPEIIIVNRINRTLFNVRFGRSFEMATAAPVLVLPIL